MSTTAVLRELLTSGETLVMPDAFDPLSARLIEQVGFKAVQCSGFSMAATQVTPEPAFGFERNLATTAAIAAAVKIPVMADGEDGFGDVSAIPQTIRAYVEAGVAGINLEDQVLGGRGPKQVIPLLDAVDKLQAARQAATEAGARDLVINARTDAIPAGATAGEGMADAIARANVYLQSGADLAFIIGVDTLEQVKQLVQEIAGPISIAAGMPTNVSQFSIAQLRDAGVARVSLPSMLLFTALRAMRRSLESVQRTDSFKRTVAQDLASGMGDIMALLSP